MKPILLASLAGLALLSTTTMCLRVVQTAKKARMLLILFLAILPFLIAADLLTPSDLGFLPSRMVMPVRFFDLAFAIFLYGAGFFGGVLQLYNLADRGLSLRILIDIWEAPTAAVTVEQERTAYGAGRGLDWMYNKRIEAMIAAGLTDLEDGRLTLTRRGHRVAGLFACLQGIARIPPPVRTDR